MIGLAGLANLVAYSAQVAVIVAGGALLPWLARVDAPGVRYAYWRALAALCLVLPWVQSYRTVVSTAVSTKLTGPSAAAGGGAAVPIEAIHGVLPDLAAIVMIVLLAGTTLRLTWISIGLMKLRRLRLAGVLAHPSETQVELQQALGTRATVRLVPALAQPLTFGVWAPVVLLPESLREHPLDIQQAVLGHELLHVQRHDWAWLLVEEAVRAVFWFHPAIWWLISRIQLAREEAVDEMTVMLTGRRKTYVEALLAFADDAPLVPTAAFARRRHLFRRIISVSKEVGMSANRVVLSGAVMALVVLAGSWYAVTAFPLQQATLAASVQGPVGPLERSAKPITPENPIPRRTNYAVPEYPADLAAVDAYVTVTLRLTIDDLGRVAEVRRLRGTCRTDNGSFSTNAENDTVESLRSTSTPTAPGGDARQMLEVLDAFTRSAVEAVRQWRYDPPASAPISLTLTFNFRPRTARGELFSEVRTETETSVTSDGAVRVGGNIKPPKKLTDVRPVFPEAARAAGIQGVVVLELRIGPDGTVGHASVLRSIPMLDDAAVEAVEQWKFVPTLLNGRPVPVIMTVTVNFLM